MIITFTGTSKKPGMTQRQKDTLTTILKNVSEDSSLIFLHGDCVWADAQAHVIAQRLGIDIELYPCDIEFMRAYCMHAKVIHEIMRPLKRNDIMAKRCDLLIAAPKSLNEEQRSGTWATIRYARKYNKKSIILEP